MLRRAVDDLVVIETPERFSNVSEYYLDFHQLTDEGVLEYLQRVRTEPQVI
jgi:predicted phosphoribosyltransferase